MTLVKSNIQQRIEPRPLMWNVGLYIRLSKEDYKRSRGLQDSSNSVENQKGMGLDYIKNSSNLKLFDIYIDDGFTGTDTDRDSFQRLLNDVEQGKINCVIVKDLSRLSRNYFEAGYIIEKTFVIHDVRFITLTSPIVDSYENPASVDSIVIPMTNVINDNFCKETSNKVREVLKYKKEHGLFCAAFCPFGLKKSEKNKNILDIDDPAAAIVRLVFTLYVIDDLSQGHTARRLNELGIPTPSQYRKLNGSKYCNPMKVSDVDVWTSATVSYILTNPAYLGHAVQGKYKIKSYKVHKQVRVPEEDWIVVEFQFPQIIETEMFNKAQYKKSKQSKQDKTGKVKTLAGLVRCGDCNRAMYYIGGKEGYCYYVCSTYHSNKNACTGKRIRESKLIEIVLKSLQLQIKLAVEVQKLLSEDRPKENKSYENNFENLIKIKTSELMKAEKMRNDLYPDWKNGYIDEMQYWKLKEEIELSIATTNKELEEIQNLSKQDTQINVVTRYNAILEDITKHQNITILTRGIALELIEQITFYDDNVIDIKFKFSDIFTKIQNFIGFEETKKCQ